MLKLAGICIKILWQDVLRYASDPYITTTATCPLNLPFWLSPTVVIPGCDHGHLQDHSPFQSFPPFVF